MNGGPARQRCKVHTAEASKTLLYCQTTGTRPGDLVSQGWGWGAGGADPPGKAVEQPVPFFASSFQLLPVLGEATGRGHRPAKGIAVRMH